VVDQRRRRDFQISRADVKLLPAEIIKLPGRSLIERNDFELLSGTSYGPFARFTSWRPSLGVIQNVPRAIHLQ